MADKLKNLIAAKIVCHQKIIKEKLTYSISVGCK